MLTTSIIGYSHNQFIDHQRGIGYPLVDIRKYDPDMACWKGSFHLNESNDSWMALCQRTAKLTEYLIQKGSRVIILGGDITGLGIFDALNNPSDILDLNGHDYFKNIWMSQIIQNPTVGIQINIKNQLDAPKYAVVSVENIPQTLPSSLECLYIYDVNCVNANLISVPQLMEGSI